MGASGKLRVGIVDYLNAWPLAWGFLTGRLDDSFEARYLPPADVARELADGRIELGLIPSVEARRQPGLLVVPGLCVAATHEVRSVILVSRGSLEEVRRVALDRNSRTSAALVRILLRERYGLDPHFEEASPDVGEMLDRADAALIIGDPALEVDRARYKVWDLAAEWRALTGRPFVFAVWALRAEASHRLSEVEELLTDSLDRGLAELDEVVGRAVRELGLGEAAVRDYLTESLSFRLDSEARAGLREFYERAAAIGLIESTRALGESV